jgi:hypothetical protein
MSNKIGHISLAAFYIFSMKSVSLRAYRMMLVPGARYSGSQLPLIRVEYTSKQEEIFLRYSPYGRTRFVSKYCSNLHYLLKYGLT